MDKIKIVIIDDHKMVREGLQQLLELDGEIEVVGQAGDGIEGINLIKKVNPDVALLDINMPNLNGIETLERLKRLKTSTKILILTIHNEIEYLLKAVNLGVDGYILKDSECSTLKTAINTVYNGNSYIQPSLSPLLKKYFKKNNEPKKNYGLSPREMDVLKLMYTGLVFREIADILDISEKTVKNHVAHIYKKMDVKDRTQAVVLAIKDNILEID